MSAMLDEEVFVEAEIVDDSFKAPVLQDIKYPVTEDYLISLAAKYSDVPDIYLDADDEVIKEQFDFVIKGHKTLVKVRNKIEKTRKTIKDPAYTFGKNVDAFAKKLKSIIAIPEEKLKIQRLKVEQNEARKQAEAEAKEEARIEQIKAFIHNIKNLPLQHFNSSSSEITDALKNMKIVTKEEFEEFFDEALEVRNLVISQLNTALDNKLLVENAEKIQAQKDAEDKKLKDEEDAKLQAEKDELAKQQAEFQKQKDEFEDQQREQQEILDRQEAVRKADALQEAQLKEREARLKEDKERHEAMLLETLSVMESYSDMKTLLDDIVSDKVACIKWVSNV